MNRIQDWDRFGARAGNARPGGLRSGALGPDLLHLLQGGAQVRQPRILVLADQAHAPGQRVAAAAGDPGVHQGVEDEPLRLASRVMTGTEKVVNITFRSPHVTPQDTLRPNRCSASRAISIRS